jgi:hypothetical protein
MGSFSQCSDDTVEGESACVPPLEWVPPPITSSFDSFGTAMLTLYTMATGDDWATSMFRMMDATAAGRGPQRHDSSAAAIFALAWMFVGSFFAMNLVVGVIVDKFNRDRSEMAVPTIVTPEQQRWIDSINVARESRQARSAPAPGSGCRCLHRVVTSPIFERVVSLLVLSSVAIMSCYYWGLEDDKQLFDLYTRALQYISYAFYVECALKVLALGPALYLVDGWGRFDAALVVLTLADQLLQTFVEHRGSLPLLLRALRVVNILRTFRLLKRATALNKLINTLMLSLPALVNVGAVLALVRDPPPHLHSTHIMYMLSEPHVPSTLLLTRRCPRCLVRSSSCTPSWASSCSASCATSRRSTPSATSSRLAARCW